MRACYKIKRLNFDRKEDVRGDKMTDEINQKMLELGAELESATSSINRRLNQLYDILIEQDRAPLTGNWQICINSTIKDMMANDEGIAERIMGLIDAVLTDISRIKTEPHSGKTWLRMLDHMQSILHLSMQLDLIEYKPPSGCGHCRNYYINQKGDLYCDNGAGVE